MTYDFSILEAQVEQHTPHPGSSRDMVGKTSQAVPETPIREISGNTDFIVPVREEVPALGVGNVVVLSSVNTVQLLLPQDPLRRSAVVLAIDNDIYLATSKELAQAAEGTNTAVLAAYIPAGIAVPVNNQAAWYAAATTTVTSSRITVIISRDDRQ